MVSLFTGDLLDRYLLRSRCWSRDHPQEGPQHPLPNLQDLGVLPVRQLGGAEGLIKEHVRETGCIIPPPPAS